MTEQEMRVRIAELERQLSVHDSEIVRLRVDAERYQWLRLKWAYTIFHAIFGAPESGPSFTPDKLDAAIDAAKGQ